MNSKGFKKRAPVPPPLSKEAEKEEGKKERKARGGRKNAGWNRWDDYYPRLARKRRDEKETRARAHVQGEKKNFPRLANCPNRRTNYHPESQQSVPFSFARILAFSPLPSLFLPMAPWEFPPCTFDLSQSQPFSLSLCVCVNVSTRLPRGPVVLRLLLVSQTLAFLSSRSSPPIIRDSSVVVRA